MAIEPSQSDSSAPPGTLDVQVAADSPTSFSAMSQAPTATEAPPAAAAPAPRRKRPLIIVTGIAAAMFISLLAIALLYYKWYKNDEYNTLIIVWGQDAWNGATVSVTGPHLSGTLVGELTEREHQILRFHVPPGDYMVRVQKGNSTIAQRTPLAPLKANTIWWPFRSPPSATQMGQQ